MIHEPEPVEGWNSLNSSIRSAATGSTDSSINHSRRYLESSRELDDSDLEGSEIDELEAREEEQSPVDRSHVSAAPSTSRLSLRADSEAAYATASLNDSLPPSERPHNALSTTSSALPSPRRALFDLNSTREDSALDLVDLGTPSPARLPRGCIPSTPASAARLLSSGLRGKPLRVRPSTAGPTKLDLDLHVPSTPSKTPAAATAARPDLDSPLRAHRAGAAFTSASARKAAGPAGSSHTPGSRPLSAYGRPMTAPSTAARPASTAASHFHVPAPAQVNRTDRVARWQAANSAWSSSKFLTKGNGTSPAVRTDRENFHLKFRALHQLERLKTLRKAKQQA